MKKDSQVMIKVSEEERDGFRRAAEIAGVGLSAWARQKLRSAAIKDLQEVGEKIPFLQPISLK
jgi:hypothetical protein